MATQEEGVTPTVQAVNVSSTEESAGELKNIKSPSNSPVESSSAEQSSAKRRSVKGDTLSATSDTSLTRQDPPVRLRETRRLLAVFLRLEALKDLSWICCFTREQIIKDFCLLFAMKGTKKKAQNSQLQHAIPRRNFQKKEIISLYWELFLINDFIFFLIYLDVRVSLRASRLISRSIKYPANPINM